MAFNDGDAETPVLPDFTTMNVKEFHETSSESFSVIDRIAFAFAPFENTTPDMTIQVNTGALFNGTTLTEKDAIQTVTLATADPTNPRIDRIVLNRLTGIATKIDGTPASTPVPPAITTGNVPVAQIWVQNSVSEITNDNITDERVLSALGLDTPGDLAFLDAGDGIEDDSAGYARVKLDGTTIARSAAGIKVETSGITATEIAADAVTLAKLEDGTQGDILYYGASGAPTRLTAGTSGQFLKTQGAAANPVWAANAGNESNRNRLFNGDGVVDQRIVSTAINDDTYAWDRWVVLSDGNGVATPSQETSDLPTGARAAMKMTVAVANKKFGILQIVEGVNCKDLIDDVASLSMQLKASGLTNVRAAILSWTGTEDAVTSDVVSAWNAAGTNPTLVANWTYENTPANISVSGAAWAGDTSIANISIDTASTKQVAAFIWVDDTDAAVSDTLLVSDVQLEPGTAATGFERRPLTTELASCQRYYEKTFDLSAVPGSLTTSGQSYWVSPGTSGRFPLLFQTRKRTVPAVTSYSYATGASGVVRNTSTNVDVSASAVNTGEQATLLTFTASSTNEFASQWAAEAEL